MYAKSAKSKKIVLGLTGGIASGKTTVSNYFIKKGIKVVDSDKIVHDLYDNNKQMKEEILLLLNINLDEIDYKKAIANKIFNNKNLREKINNIIHPLVVDELIKQRDNNNDKLVILDIPLIYEANLTHLVDDVITVYVDEGVQLSRLIKRNSYTKEEALSRINAQIPLKDKINLSKYKLNNNNTKEDLYKQIDKLIKELI